MDDQEAMVFRGGPLDHGKRALADPLGFPHHELAHLGHVRRSAAVVGRVLLADLPEAVASRRG